MPDAPVSIALIGMGTVGTGVARVLLEQPERIARRAGRAVRLKHVVVRDLNRPRALELPPAVLTSDVQKAAEDRDVQIAVHLVGGVHPARELMLAMLESGKDIVTANKALLCEHGQE